jgi:hypothetical protein
MKHLHLSLLPLLILACASLSAEEGKSGWRHSGTLTILTTPEGAELPAGKSVSDFPLLVRLHSDFFDFSQALRGGGDIRFSDSKGAALAYEVEEWNAEGGNASLWVRIPRIEGDSRQQLRMHWGNAKAKSESDGAAVFNESNGYVSVWHLGDEVKDEVGTLESKDVGTTPTPGMIGKARHFPGEKGVFCGEKIPDYPSGNQSHSTQAWFRAEKPNSTIIGWGNEGGGRGTKVRMQYRSPPHIHIDSDFSDVNGEGLLTMREWVHVTHTYDHKDGRIYINGRLDGANNPLLNIKTPSRLWLGGWYHHYDYVGDIDEVRISRVARSADWIRLEYENQKRLQTLVGPVEQKGTDFSVSGTKLSVNEGENAFLTARAGGAQKVYWTLTRNGREQVVATDRFAFTFEAGRVAGNEKATLQLKAVYPDTVKTRNVEITILERIPEPVFTLRAPKTWDGRKPIEIISSVTSGGENLDYTWEVAPIAVIKRTAPGRLLLDRALNSGKMTVTATISNGGKPTTRSLEIQVEEPREDAWVPRKPAAEEHPVDNQFFARDDQNKGTLYCIGKLKGTAERVYVKLYADAQLIKTESQQPAADHSYRLSLKLKPGLTRYRIELGTKTAGRETVLRSAKNLVCGDAYLINGQSNAVATDWGKGQPTFRSEWLRSFGCSSSSPRGIELWGEATHRSRNENLQVGYWAMELGRRLIEKHKVPIFLVNGAVGGTRVDQHQRNPENPEDTTTIYGRLLWRLRRAKLTHGVRGVIWHQGENDQGAAGPTGGYGWETYRQYFIDLAAAWKLDYPNIRHYYAFQIWPKSCAMGIKGSDNRLREVQRNLPTAFSNLDVLSTLGIKPPGTCHYPAAGYAEFARLLHPLIERDHYGGKPAGSITAANLRSASYSDGERNSITLEFDQPVKWTETLLDQFYLDGKRGRVTSGAADGRTLILDLDGPSTAKQITYLDSKSWNPKNLLRGENGIAALTFCEVPILPAGSTGR